ncbi:MAG TPA: 2-dehydropantoate 2-reductase [Thermoplasmata archaeon]|nr:2-dehydropantoate 2-reductase [Thermoplasmata archaeon]
MRIVILGAGAIGSLIGAMLHRAGEDVVLVGSPAHVEAIRAGGLRVEGRLEGTFAIAAETRLAPGTSADLVWFTVKTFDLARATEQAARELPGSIPWVLPQNGLGVEEVARTAMRSAGRVPDPDRWLVRAVNTIPATLVAPGIVRQPGDGEIRLAHPSHAGASEPSVRLVAASLVRAGVPVRFVPDIDRAAWRKAVVNAAINPVTAEYGILNGQLLQDPWRSEATTLLLEALSAARLAGYDFSLEELERDLWETVRATAGNRSSMLQDIDRGRPTEIDSISGYLLDTARLHSVNLPATERIVERIRRRAASAPHPRQQRS